MRSNLARACIIVTVAAASIGAAQASEPGKAKAPHDWSGAYAGVTLGGAWDTSADDRNGAATLALPPSRTLPDARREAAPAGSPKIGAMGLGVEDFNGLR